MALGKLLKINRPTFGGCLKRGSHYAIHYADFCAMHFARAGAQSTQGTQESTQATFVAYLAPAPTDQGFRVRSGPILRNGCVPAAGDQEPGFLLSSAL
jgi:hypothetical protein